MAIYVAFPSFLSRVIARDEGSEMLGPKEIICLNLDYFAGPANSFDRVLFCLHHVGGPVPNV